MEEVKQKHFNTRAFVVTTAAFAVLGLILSGVMNHAMHHGSVGFFQQTWRAFHWLLGIIFIFFAVWHSILNRRAIAKYIKDFCAGTPACTRELIFSLAVVGILFLLSIIHSVTN